jgi:hypothetical protein
VVTSDTHTVPLLLLLLLSIMEAHQEVASHLIHHFQKLYLRVGMR